MYLNKINRVRPNYEAGFLLPLALFIVVVMGVLALSISRTATQTQSSSIAELINVQTFYAGETGAQRAMQVLFFPDSTSRQAVDGRCASLNQNFSFSGINGLNLCSAQVSCRCRYANGSVCSAGTATNYSTTAAVGLTISFYTISSVANCGQADINAMRTIEANAFLEQE